MDGAADKVIVSMKVVCGFIDELNDLLGSFSEKDPFFRQCDFSVPAAQELFAELFLQIHQLAGKSRLCNVQSFRRAGDGFFSGDSEKIAQNPDFHNGCPPCMFRMNFACVGKQLPVDHYSTEKLCL